MRHFPCCKNTKLVWFVFIAGLAAPLSMLFSAEQQKPTPEPNYKIVNVQADVWKQNWGSKSLTLLTGNVVITQGDTVLKSDRVEFDEDANIATSPGRLTITDPNNEISGASGIAYLNDRRGEIKGSVKLVTKPKQKPDPNRKSTEWKDTVTMTCDKIEYLYKLKKATAGGNLKMVQKDRTVTADQAIYLVKDEIVTLNGNVKGIDTKGQSVTAGGKVTASLKEGDEWIEIERASGIFKVKEEEEEQKPAEKPAAAKS
ncbi:MAG: LptA/OstA family protein [Armatimonadota bacterium]|nr:LptA/OstA family protein [Armatimonadota bacterium]